jgi:hypothetical protein
LHDATAIRLRLTRDLSFTNVIAGETVDFEILDDLRVDGLLVMARGRATATITEVEPKTRMGKGGKLGVSLPAIQLLNGDHVAIRAAKQHTDSLPAAESAMVKPAAPSLLFSYTREQTFPEGTAITVYTDGETKLDPAKFLLDIAFTSNPPGAAVSMYGAFVGRTPFTARLAAGTYKAVFTAEGHPDLTERISVGPGLPDTVHAALESK